MALLIDANVLLDWLLDREPFAEDAGTILQFCLDGKADGYLAGHTILNAFFLARKKLSGEYRRFALLFICEEFVVMDIKVEVIVELLEDEHLKDLEDALQIYCANLASADYIITRDLKDFKNSPVPALSPKEFLKMVGA